MREIGRAGRDGLLATATIFCTNRDIAANVKHLREEMRDICLIKSCRQAKLLSYFGDKTVLLTSHTCCDNCRLTSKYESCLQVNCHRIHTNFTVFFLLHTVMEKIQCFTYYKGC